MDPKLGSITCISYVPNMVWRDSKINGRHWFLSMVDIISEIISPSLNKIHNDTIKDNLSRIVYKYISGIKLVRF